MDNLWLVCGMNHFHTYPVKLLQFTNLLFQRKSGTLLSKIYTRMGSNDDTGSPASTTFSATLNCPLKWTEKKLNRTNTQKLGVPSSWTNIHKWNCPIVHHFQRKPAWEASSLSCSLCSLPGLGPIEMAWQNLWAFYISGGETSIYTPVIKHGWLENGPFIGDFPSYKPQFSSGIFHCHVWLPEGIKNVAFPK